MSSVLFDLSLLRPTSPAAGPSSSGTVAVSFTAGGGADSTGFRVHYSTSNPPLLSDPYTSGASSPISVTSLSNGTVYYFAVSEVGDDGSEGPLSVVASATPSGSSGSGVPGSSFTPRNLRFLPRHLRSFKG